MALNSPGHPSDISFSIIFDYLCNRQDYDLALKISKALWTNVLNFDTRQTWVQIPGLPLTGSGDNVRQVI